MNDDRMEELLRKTWQPEPPEGMRERVLARAYEKMAKRRRFDFTWMLGWKPALTALGIAIVLLSSIADNRREARLTAMVGGPGVSSPTRSGDYLRMRREMNDMLASMPVDGRSAGQSQEGGRL